MHSYLDIMIELLRPSSMFRRSCMRGGKEISDLLYVCVTTRIDMYLCLLSLSYACMNNIRRIHRNVSMYPFRGRERERERRGREREEPGGEGERDAVRISSGGCGAPTTKRSRT